MPISPDKLRALCGGTWLREGLSNDIHELVYDSRRLAAPGRSAFFALRSGGRDGADYIDAAYRAGVRTFVVHHDFYPDKRWYEGSFIAVDHTLHALQAVATYQRKQSSARVIGITGSNGKTIVKDWLSWLLEPDYRICRSPKSYNSQLGVPISVWQLRKDDEFGIFEAGISQPKEMPRLESIIQPHIGIFTHLGDAHDENFDTTAQKLAEKFELFKQVKQLVLCTDLTEVRIALAQLQQSRNDLEVLAWSRQQPTAYRLVTETPAEGGTKLEMVAPDGPHALYLPFTDAASIENAMHCWVLLHHLGYHADVLRERFSRLPRLQMRLEIKAALQGCTLINDSYSLDLDSLELALDQLIALPGYQKRLVILSEFDRESQHDAALYQRVAQMLETRRITWLLGVGKAFKTHKKYFEKLDARFYEHTDQLLAAVPVPELNQTAILLKGARKFGFERVDRLLSLKLHQTVLEVDLDALLHNYRYFRGLLQPGTKIMVMVKAFSYGSGSVEVAGLLQQQRADYLAVAFADEGVVLRQAGIHLPIMVMNVEPGGIEKLLQYRLEPEVYSFRLLDELEIWLKTTGGDERLPIHLNIDTGMKRLGFETTDVAALVSRLRRHPRLQVASVYSHLVASDAPEHTDFTQQQISRFDAAYQQLVAGLGYQPLQHILNTAGILRFPQAQFNMVRLGIGLYGFDPSESPVGQSVLQPVGTLKTVISQIHALEAGETVGYSRRGKALQPMRIATLPVGYADGIVRAFGNGKVRFWINGKMAPTVGSICMDMCMVDVTHIDCREGDPVILFGRENPIQQIANAIDTIPYEILTNVSQRVKRVYLKD
jgi:alanine racemase